MRGFFRGFRFFARHVYQHAQLSAEVDVLRKESFRFVRRESAYGNLFADNRRLTFQVIFNGVAVGNFAGSKRFRVRGLFRKNHLRNFFGNRRKLRVLRHEVRFAVHFHKHAFLIFDIRVNDTFRRNAGSLLFRFRNAPFAKEVHRLFHIAVGIRQRFFAIHYARARLFAQSHYVFCRKRHCFILLSLIFLCFPVRSATPFRPLVRTKRKRRERLPQNIRNAGISRTRRSEISHGALLFFFACYSAFSSASAAGSAATTSSISFASVAVSSCAGARASAPWFASITAFAITDVISLIARIASSLPGIT